MTNEKKIKEYLNTIEELKYLLDKENIFIKDLKDKDGFNKEDYIRIAVKAEEENNKLIQALKNYKEEL